MQPYWDKPCASAGLTSYRYKGRYGWIMVGAKNHGEALTEVLRSLSSGSASFDNLEVWDMLAGCYVKVSN
jgi:Iap family predicted aminopeptidase